MKISKLFHWLYAILMLLPAFFVGGRMAYTIFNKNAKDSYTDNIKEYVNYNNFKVNENYYMELKPKVSNFAGFANFTINNLSFVNSNANNASWSEITNISIYYLSNSDNATYQYKDNLSNTLFTYTSEGNPNLLMNMNIVSADTNAIRILNSQSSIYRSINNSLDNAFSYSVNQLNENVLFSWAKDSFIVEPFRYITGLFGMPSDSPVLTLLSYWCSISLIWLTFDLLMYVPLLVHRWLDKGVLE